MDETPDYSRYSWEQLQDALSHINREQNPVLFAALQREIESRLNQPPLPPVVAPIPAVTPQVAVSSFPITTRNGCLPAFCGWLGGAIVGGIAGGITTSSIFDARVQTLNIADSDAVNQFALFQVAVFLGAVVICNVTGLFVGLRLYERHSN